MSRLVLSHMHGMKPVRATTNVSKIFRCHKFISEFTESHRKYSSNWNITDIMFFKCNISLDSDPSDLTSYWSIFHSQLGKSDKPIDFSKLWNPPPPQSTCLANLQSHVLDEPLNHPQKCSGVKARWPDTYFMFTQAISFITCQQYRTKLVNESTAFKDAYLRPIAVI